MKQDGRVLLVFLIGLVRCWSHLTSTKLLFTLYIMASLTILRLVSRLVHWSDFIMADTLDFLE